MNGGATYRSYLEGPRHARFGTALRNRVWSDPSLDLVMCETDKRLFRETVRFEVRGTTAAIVALQADLLAGMDEWNSR